MLGREESERGAARDRRGGGGTALLGSSSRKKKRRRGTRHSTGNKAGGEIADKDVRRVRMAGTWNEDGRRRCLTRGTPRCGHCTPEQSTGRTVRS